MKYCAVCGLMMMVLVGSVVAQTGDIPRVPYVEVYAATEGPLSYFCVPGGGGNPLTEAFDQWGQTVDGTLTMTLYSDQPGWGEPVPDYPKEDMWLMDQAGHLALCSGGTIPDADTDADGVTTWSGALRAGGQVDPAAGSSLAVFVTGWVLGEAFLTDIRINSADFNGDLVVNLSDVAYFTEHYFGAYGYAFDLRWDGVINLSDLALLATSYSTSCP